MREALTHNLDAVEELSSVDVGWAGDDDPVTAEAQELASYLLTHRARPIRRLDDLLAYENSHGSKNPPVKDQDGALYVDPLARLGDPW